MTLGTESVSLLFQVIGLCLDGALQRQFGDAHAVNAHIAFTFDVVGSSFGRVALGLPSENPTL